MSTTTELKRLIGPYALQPKTVTSFTRLEIMRLDHPTALQPVIYEPAVCLVLQGAKRAVIGDKALAYGEGDYFIAAAEVAALGRISDATKDEPYLALTLLLDPQVIAGVLLDLPKGTEPAVSSGFFTSTADSKLLDAWLRLVSVLERPDEAAVLAPMIEREILFRLLQSPSGVLLRQIAGGDNRLSNIRKAMAWLREHYAEPVRVEQLAAIAAMSPSVFHKHFKDVTALSPIQYQKHIRLHEARRRLSQAPLDAAGVAFSIGYESASQFSREYKRLFGASPVQDAKQLQSLVG